jgi:hypothetical protein
MQMAATFGKLPLSFEKNVGQADPTVDFISHGGGQSVYIAGGEAVLALGGAAAPPIPSEAPVRTAAPTAPLQVLRLQLLGASPSIPASGLEQLPGTANYLIGNTPSRWHTGIPTYARVGYQGVLPGVDMAWYGSGGRLEYDLTLAPGVDPAIVRLAYRGAEGLTLGSDGALLVHMPSGTLAQQAPVLYQQVAGSRRLVDGRYLMLGSNEVGFAVGPHDAHVPLVIDPVLAYSTYLGGGADDQGNDIAVDASGNAYVTGVAGSTDFPTTPGAFQATKPGSGDAFVTKLNPTGTAVLYSTYLGGGNDNDIGRGIAVDSAGEAFVVGTANSDDFPITPGAFQTTNRSRHTAFVAKLNAAGSSLVYSTFLGGSSIDEGIRIALDGARDAFVSGNTFSGDFPTTPGALQPSLAGGITDGFVTKLNPTGSSLLYSTYLGGTGGDGAEGIAVDGAGDAYVAGTTLSSDFPTTPGAFMRTMGVGAPKAFVSKINAAGSALLYSTYLGGTNRDEGVAIAVDGAGDAYLTGFTSSADLPTTPGSFQRTFGGTQDAFVTKFNSTGSALIYSTYLGGSGADAAIDIKVDGAGNAYVTGRTASADYPTVTPIQATFGGGVSDAFLSKIDAAGSALVYSTYLGGSQEDHGFGVAVDSAGNAYVTGRTKSTDFPTMTPIQAANRGGAYDAFIAKINSPSSVHTSLTVTSSSNPSLLGQSVSFTATITPSAAAGSVQFSVDGNTLGGPVTVSGGSATSPAIGSLSPGSHTVMATFTSSSPSFLGSSGSLTQTVGFSSTVSGSISSLVVNPGQSVHLLNANVSGAVTVKPGGALFIDHSTVGGATTATGATSFYACGSSLHAVFVRNSSGFVFIGDVTPADDAFTCAPNTINGFLQVMSNSGGVEVGGNTISGRVTFSNNSGSGATPEDAAPELEGNHITGALACSGNVASFTNDGKPNSVSSARSGQCGAGF